MNNASQDVQIQVRFRQVLATLWKHRWFAVAAAWGVAVLAVPAVLLTPNRYEASAQIYVDTQTVLKPLMQGLAYTPDVDQQVRMLARTLISRPNAERLASRADLDIGPMSNDVEREKTINRFMDRMKVTPVPATTNLYAITYRDTDAARAKRIVDATLALFVDAGSANKRRDSEEASAFIDQQIKLSEAKLVEAENRLKDFKLKNFGVSGVPEHDFFARMSTLVEEVSKLRVDLSAAEQARDAFKRELSGENPQLPTDAVPGLPPPPPSEIETRLETQKRLLDDLLRKYTDQHPDVIATRRLVAQLEVEKRKEAEEKAATGKGKGLAATSPVYQRLRVSLAEAEAQVASLRSQLALKSARLEDVRKVANRAPQLEAELTQLNRDYDVIKKNYEALVARRESASLGVRLDEGSKLADFRVVEPPRVGDAPVLPSRLHVALLAALLALVAGLGVPLLIELLRPTFKDAAELTRVTGRQVLGAISVAVNDEYRLRMRGQGIGVLAACSGLLLVQTGWLLWLASQSH
jgi:polysaccharide chain length determinant protein (PEP-CTERM system associated)